MLRVFLLKVHFGGHEKEKNNALKTQNKCLPSGLDYKSELWEQMTRDRAREREVSGPGGRDKNITSSVYYCRSQTVFSHAGKWYGEYSSYRRLLS